MVILIHCAVKSNMTTHLKNDSLFTVKWCLVFILPINPKQNNRKWKQEFQEDDLSSVMQLTCVKVVIFTYIPRTFCFHQLYWPFQQLTTLFPPTNIKSLWTPQFSVGETFHYLSRNLLRHFLLHSSLSNALFRLFWSFISYTLLNGLCSRFTLIRCFCDLCSGKLGAKTPP